MYKLLAALLIFLGFSASVFSQRVSYPQLVNRSETPEIFINDILIPNNDSSSTLAFIFRFNNDFLPFRKLQASDIGQAPSGSEFYTTLRFSAEIFDGKISKRKDPASNSRARDSWTDTLYVSSFEDTKSNKEFASGALTARLTPGTYNFILQLSLLQEINERSTQKREIEVPELDTLKRGEVYLIRSANGQNLELMNMNDNIEFGKDFTALIRLPKYDTSKTYSVKIIKTDGKKTDKNVTSANELFRTELSEEMIQQNSSLSLIKSKDPAISLNKNKGNFTYAVVPIPSGQFDNSMYKLLVTESDKGEIVAEKVFKTHWQDMPASLYNLDIAIDMLRYIIPQKEIDRINQGSDKEREEKFREFWKSKDPTPNTVYNELMAEYYRRIDYAFKEYGSQENPYGHENDQGEIYIKFGPPSSKERVFPPGGKTREIWKYPDRTFVFEAATGFGDFKLVGRQ